MIPRKIYLQYVGDSDEKPTDSDDIRDGDVTWSRERIFKHDLVFYRRVASHLNKAEATTAETSTQQGKISFDEAKEYWRKRDAHTDAINKAQRSRIERDYEPEQKYGTAADIQEHIKYGGDRNDY